MALLFALLWFFGTWNPPPKCPPLRNEFTAKFVTLEEYKHEHSDLFKESDYFVATTTLDGRLQDGYATDTEAIAFNKKVRECQIVNGEFK